MYIDDSCIGCGLCEDSCAVGAISLVEEKAVINKDICTECTACAFMCPLDAVHEED